MSVSREPSLKILNSNADFKDILYTNSSGGNSYKFFVPWNVDILTVELTIIKSCDDCIDVIFLVQSNSLPTSKSFLHSTIIKSNETGKFVIEFYPHENSWHYIDLKFFTKSPTNDGSAQKDSTSFNTSTTSANTSSEFHSTTSTTSNTSISVHSIDFNIALYFSHKNINDEEFKGRKDDDETLEYTKYMPFIPKKRNFVEYPLLRQTYREFFMYDYDLIADVNGTVPASINLTSGMPALMKFDIGDVYDIGGTLSFAISMRADGMIVGLNENHQHVTNDNHRLGGESGEHAVAEKLTSDESKPLPLVGNQTVIVCLRLNEPGMPTWPDKCVYGRQSFIANSIINNTDPVTSTGLIHVAFPETVKYFL